MMARAARVLVNELQESAADDGFDILALVVRFGDAQQAGFVLSDDPDPIAKLSEMMSRGGRPLGLIAFKAGTGGQGRTGVMPFEEYADEEWVEKYLWTVEGTLRRKVRGLNDA